MEVPGAHRKPSCTSCKLHPKAPSCQVAKGVACTQKPQAHENPTLHAQAASYKRKHPVAQGFCQIPADVPSCVQVVQGAACMQKPLPSARRNPSCTRKLQVEGKSPKLQAQVPSCTSKLQVAGRGPKLHQQVAHRSTQLPKVRFACRRP